MLGGYSINSGILFGMAVKAHQRLKDSVSDTTPDQRDALVAILFSAATLEAYINELTLYANQAPGVQGPFQMLAGVLNSIEEGNGSVREKYMLAKIVLSGEPYNKGARPYQDFALLFTIRNAIVHMQPEHITEDEHHLLKRLKAKKLCAAPPKGSRAGWIYLIATRAMSRWACNIVGDMVDSIRSCMPTTKELSAFVRMINMIEYNLVEF
jgi:hypothetical protein